VDELAPNRSGIQSRSVFAGAIVVIAAIPIVVALLLNGGSNAVPTPAAPSTVASHFQPVAAAKTPSQPNLLLPPGHGALVALVSHPTKMRAKPGGHVFATLPVHTGFGSPDAVWVARLSGAWLGVVSTLAGNHRLGWIRAADASLSRVNWEIKVSLTARMVTVMHSGKAVEHYEIAIGAPDAPTPTGRFAVTDRLNTGDPTGPYGCCILALSALAPHAIQGWDGGNRIAIHSTPETSSIGHDVSHGCMRLTLPEGRWLLDHIPLGTPTLISA
jgi:lipoprotein-anchoring transpeptidase ErfK/SrfK